MLSVYSNAVPVKLAHGREARPVIDDRQRDACQAVCLKIAKRLVSLRSRCVASTCLRMLLSSSQIGFWTVL